jgi:hypothetical protein
VNILTAQDKVPRFLGKFQLFRRRVEGGDVPISLRLTTLLVANKLKCSFADVARHLLSGTESIIRYFPGIKERGMNACAVN